MRNIRPALSSSSLLSLAVACIGLVASCDDSEDPADASVADAPVDSPPRDAGVPDRAPTVDTRPPDTAVDAAGAEVLPRPDANPPDVTRVDGGPAVTMSFFITSTGSGAVGGNLGGLAGADMKCQTLAAAVGLGNKTWHAYLSTHAGGGDAGAAVNAKDRIGTGPWYDYHGIQIAANVADLHTPPNETAAPYLNLETALDERGALVPGRGSANPPGNQHDILTGSNLDGTAMGMDPDRTCTNWTSNTTPVDGGPTVPTAQVGHFDRQGGGANPLSWNSAHATPACDEASLRRVGGAGRLYCFAIN